MKRTIIVWALLMTVGSYAQNLKLTADNVDKIVEAMTLEEKAAIIVGKGAVAFDGRGKIYDYVAGSAGATNPIDRLGVPPIVYADGPSGLRIDNKQTTRFPNGLLQAASWNVAAIESLSEAYGAEAKALGVDVVLGPGINIQRNPLCGRNFEYLSEDPLLSGLTAAAIVRGIQKAGVGACPKHFAVNNQELNRLNNDSRVSQRTLREVYLRNFEIMLRHSDPRFIMSSYNFINGVTASENRDLLTTILREEWHFNGAVVSDWGAGYDAAKMVSAGNDNIQHGTKSAYNRIIESVNNGTLNIDDVNTSVRRLLRAAVQAIRYDGGNFTDNPPLDRNALIVREQAPEGFVLLKNKDNILPLSKGDRLALLGTTSYDFIHGGTGSGFIHNPYRSVCMPEGLTDAGFTLDEELHRYYLDYMQGELKRCEKVNKNVPWCCEKERAMEAVPRKLISEAAKRDRAAVITLGRVFGEGMDRDYYHSYLLSDGEMALLRAVSDAFHREGKPLIVVLNVGGIVDMTMWQDMADAVLLCWQPGEEGGHSVADVLAGDQFPSGRLPVSIPVRYEDDPTAANFPRIKADKYENYSFYRYNGATPRYDVPNVDYTNYEEGIYVGYRYYTTRNVAVAYPFGFGLSYTTFDYKDMKVKDKGDAVEVSLTVVNKGARAGKEVVQIYCHAPEEGLDKPVRELKGYAKTSTLQPGEQERVTVSIEKDLLASFDESASAWVAPKGIYTLVAARDADTPVLTADYKLSKPLRTDCRNVLRGSFIDQ